MQQIQSEGVIEKPLVEAIETNWKLRGVDSEYKGKTNKSTFLVVSVHWVSLKDVFRAWNNTQPWEG